ncbi:PqqD family protein [Bacillaceae bacterium SIJ1]|uniref:PqqD family protein n=1 Tax=Litoribacterium kuwaitense TaxID=1398745 RepID=UPI0013E9FD67|nr:PqqD family protein [Litoribacterium kuwaitense]NGP46770.1 PqqD family protein [Litoribacterium kuwaitense]
MEKVLNQSSSVVFQKTDDGGVLLSIETGRYYRLNSSATDIWNLLEANNSTKNIIEVLARKYNSPVEEITEDVIKVINDLKLFELITVN